MVKETKKSQLTNCPKFCEEKNTVFTKKKYLIQCNS